MTKRIEMLDELGNVVHPITESENVIMSNGQTLVEALNGDGSSKPVVTHNESSFKVGKGDADVSSSVVDGFTPSMTFQGETYQNILPEPSLRNTMNNGVATQPLNQGFDDVNVIDGVFKQGVLSG